MCSTVRFATNTFVIVFILNTNFEHLTLTLFIPGFFGLKYASGGFNQAP